MTSRRVVAACAIGVLLFTFAYLAPLTGGRGHKMDEGAVVAYPERVLEGAVPHRDFLTFYGPGGFWILAGSFAVFGESVGTERAVGMVYRLMIVFALFVLGLRIAGIAGGVFAGLLATLVMGEELVWAFATYGALAFGLLALAITASAVSTRSIRRATVGLIAGGVLAGIAVLVRFDFAPAIALGALPLLTAVPVRGRLLFGGGLLAAAVVYAAHLAIVGPERIARVVGDLLASGPGRELPIPGPRVFPGNLLTFSILATVLMLVVGIVSWRRRRNDAVPRILVAASLFDLALLPYAFSRADVIHIRPVALVPVCLLPAVALYVARSRIERERLRTLAVVAVAATSVAALLAYGDLSVDRVKGVRGFRDAYRGFDFSGTRKDTRAVIARTKTLARPGETLFVGPQDLRRTNYGPTYMYFLLRELLPASYYMEMNPGTANREGSGLADELRRADWLILTSEWDEWNEPNESTDFGPSEPNEVVQDDFCLRLERGLYRLYERCDRAA